jgi:hypothetical protein
MPSIEFMDEIEALKKQVAETETAARMYCERTLKAEARAEKLEAERDALKCCGNCGNCSIIKVTKGKYYGLTVEIDYLACLLTIKNNDSDVEPWHTCQEWKAREK